MTELMIVPTGAAELHRHYPGQTEPQPAYLELCLRTGRLYADTDAEVRGARPFSVYYGFERRYPVPALTGAAADRLLEEIRPLAQRILNDWTEELDSQSNRVAVLGGDAQAAEEEIEAIVARYDDEHGIDPADLISVWDLDGATNGEEAAEYGITSGTTDERLDEIAALIRSDLAECDGSERTAETVVVAGLEEYLRDLRDNGGTGYED